MPSRQLPPSPALPPPQPTTPIIAAFSLLLLFTLCLRRRKPRTAPSSSKPPHPFPYRLLRRATSSFSPSHLLGRGGFGSVYRATLRNPTRHVAVKTMDSDSLQGDREFHNELLLAPLTAGSDFIVHVIGFSLDRKRRLLVYDLMPRGSLQDCLFQHKSPELKIWKTRFQIVLDIARALEFLHHVCENAIIHGDIKPSNILLDDAFRARIGDFGLARMKSEGQQCEVNVIEGGNNECKKDTEENGSNVEETESVTTAGLDDFAGPSHSPETTQEPDTVVTEKGSLSEGNTDMASVESGRRTKKSGLRKDWWWKQENGGEGVVKDYVMEWIGSEIKKERPRSDLIGGSSSSVVRKSEAKIKKKRLDWWMAMDDEKDKKRDRRRPAREWWKEEFCDELAKKKKKKKKKHGLGSVSNGYHSENIWSADDDMYVDRSKIKKKRSGSRNGSKGSMDWWLDGFSGELWRSRGKSHDSASCVSSTPSMRGTVCYVAPEYGRGDDLSEKCDVYSFGVLLLVLIAGRRPLQVTGSPLSEFQRANLISWSRHLARTGKLLDLVDKGVESVDHEQALLCITIALLCIQKSPSKRPSMKEVVSMLSGELDSPQLPVEFSPSPPCRFPPKLKKGPVSY